MKRTKNPNPGLLLALTPVVLTLLILGTQIFYFGVFEPHIPLAIGLAITSVVGIKLGMRWKEIERGIFHVIHVALP
jgi:NhaC family Na+:H+ antiporter